jgi:hypothetical protein
MSESLRHDLKAQFELIWNALQAYRETCIPEDSDPENPTEDGKLYDEEWDDICAVMALWREEMEYDHLELDREDGNRA